MLSDVSKGWKRQIQHPDTTYSMVKLTQYHVPEAKAFNLLGADGNTTDNEDKVDTAKPSDKGKINAILMYQ